MRIVLDTDVASNLIKNTLDPAFRVKIAPHEAARREGAKGFIGGANNGTAHWFGALSPTPFSGTLTPRSGIANVCEARSGSRFLSGFPSTVIVLLTMPRGCPQNGFRRPVAVSYWRTVTVTVACAGTVNTVLWTHFPLLFLTRYETQSGCGPKPSDADIARCRQVVRDWTLRDSRMLVDEQGRPLR